MRIAQEQIQSSRELTAIIRRDEESLVPLLADLLNTAYVRRDDRQTGRHRLNRRDGEAISLCRQGKQVRLVVKLYQAWVIRIHT